VTGIGGLLDRRIQTLSGGERQRVGLVRALAAAPRLVLFDEPFTALNESLRRELWELILALRREENLTILFVTHDLTEAFYLADRVTILLDGRVIQQGAKEDVYIRPASPEAAAFLGYRNLLRGRVAPHAGGCSIEDRGFRVVAPIPPPGEEAVVCIRPQAIKIIREGAPIRDELASNLFAAAIEEIVRLPEMAMLRLRVIASDGVRLEMRLPLPLIERLNLSVGERVTAALWTPAVLVYPARSGSGNSSTISSEPDQ
jgi:ABC-type sulfate/molybdate transport systems ATPase subunit